MGRKLGESLPFPMGVFHYGVRWVCSFVVLFHFVPGVRTFFTLLANQIKYAWISDTQHYFAAASVDSFRFFIYESYTSR